MSFTVSIYNDGRGVIHLNDTTLDYKYATTTLAEDVNTLLNGGPIGEKLMAEADKGTDFAKLGSHDDYTQTEIVNALTFTGASRKDYLGTLPPFPKQFFKVLFEMNPRPASPAKRGTRAKPKEVVKPWIKIVLEEKRARGLTNQDLQEAFDVSTSGAVSHYLTERRQVTIEQLLNIAEILEIDPIVLLGDKGLELHKKFRKENA